MAAQEGQRGVGKEVDTVSFLAFGFFFVLRDKIFVILGDEFHEDVEVHAVVIKEEIFVVVVIRTDSLLDSVGKDSVQQISRLVRSLIVPADKGMVGQVIFDNNNRHFAFQFQTQQVKLLQIVTFDSLTG